jgi:GTPase SAR1 family protein
MENQNLWMGLNRVTQVRQEIADRLGAIAQLLSTAETEGATQSGQLGLAQEIKIATTASTNFRNGVFRLLVLGDMKRGKSTFLNALLGQNLLPSDVNPCTALLTIVKYGEQEKVTVHYKDQRSPESISFDAFKQRYTIDPEESKQLEAANQTAFPEVSHAVVEHPLPLLSQSIEFIDTPGLNDTEARNELSLGYVYNCNAILFVMSATQPCTLEERRYLQNYLRDRGLTLFFLINRWDQIKASLVDVEDLEALQQAEEKQRLVFRNNLVDYCQTADGEDRYSQRVFEISSLAALRSQLKNESTEGSGFPQFLTALNQFLSRDRGNAELAQARAIARQTYQRTNAAIARRIPMLDQSIEEVVAKIAAVQSDFAQLEQIGEQFKAEIRKTRDLQAKAIADSFKNHILALEETFEQDFQSSQPDLDLLKFLDKNNQAMFYTVFKRDFERYMNDRLAAWEFIAKQKLAAAFSDLNQKAENYQAEFAQVLDVMNQKLLGDRFHATGRQYQADEVVNWLDSLGNLLGGIPDSLNDTVRSFDSFWQNILFYVCASVALRVVAIVFAGLTLNVFGVILAGLGLAALQAEYMRRSFIDATKKEFVKYLPQIAEDNYSTIQRSVQKCFDLYEQQVNAHIQEDINLRRSELNNVLDQKRSHEVDKQTELNRLQTIADKVLAQTEAIEAIAL